MKFLQPLWSSACFQLRGQQARTVLCWRPPNPPAWIKCDVASLMLEEMTTWQKPFTFSASMSFLRDFETQNKMRNYINSYIKMKFQRMLSEQVHCECHLFGLLSLRIVFQVGSLQSGAHDGQTLPSLQLTGQRQQTRLLHVQLRIHAEQD